MLDMETRAAILRLKAEGHGGSAIAKALGISPNSVRKVLDRGVSEVPELERPSSAEPHRERIVELHAFCQGNLVRVHEELMAAGITMPYSTLTGFCRREGIGVKPKKRKGEYHFDPGEEMQHDTSPHRVLVGGKRLLVQCASVVLCFSRMLFAQVYPTFNRFYCKVFLTEALKRFKGAPKQCMVDNTSVVIASGTGENAIPAPEMEAFGNRFGFEFIAHEKGDANRSARVEGPFFYIERNFYPGRTFENLSDLNRQLEAWCEQKSHRFLRELKTRPIDLYQTERLALKPLPAHVPEVYALHHRVVDLEGYVHLNANCYSAPPELIGRRLEVRETKDMVKLFDGPRRVAEHPRQLEGDNGRSTLPEHCPKGRIRPFSRRQLPTLPEEVTLRAAGRLFADFLDLSRKKHGRSARRVRRLHRIYIEYPTAALAAALDQALRYGMTDLERLERMVLREVAGNYFRLAQTDDEG